MSFLERLRNKSIEFARGRNGIDQLNKALQGLAIIFLVLSFFVKDPPIIGLALFLIVLVNFRAYSKNLKKRRAENRKFLDAIAPLSRALRIGKSQARDRKTHRYISCPHCRNILRVPRGKGKIRVTCPKCRNQFEKRV